MEPLTGLATPLEEIEISGLNLECFHLELFPNLRRLQLSHSYLKSLYAPEVPALSLKSLNSLTIIWWNDLENFPEGLHAPNLTRLELSYCQELKSLPENMQSLLPSLAVLVLLDCPELESFPKGGLPNKLQSLFISCCNKLIAGRLQWGLQSLPSLSEFSIGLCPIVESFPEETLLPPTLSSLGIHFLSKLKSLDCKGLQHLTSLTKLALCDCLILQSVPEELFAFSKLQSLEITGCSNLNIAGIMQWDLRKLPSLSDFCFGGCPDVVEFPGDMLLPSSLTSLKINHLTNLKSLNYKGLQHLTSLRELILEWCADLKSLPEEGLPSSLTYLEINKCFLLLERCRRHGADWSKISHIPNIKYRRR